MEMLCKTQQRSMNSIHKLIKRGRVAAVITSFETNQCEKMLNTIKKQ